jgi:hypothetical protein
MKQLANGVSGSLAGNKFAGGNCLARGLMPNLGKLLVSQQRCIVVDGFVVGQATTEFCYYDEFLQHQVGFHERLSQDIPMEERNISCRHPDDWHPRGRRVLDTQF